MRGEIPGIRQDMAGKEAEKAFPGDFEGTVLRRHNMRTVEEDR